MIAKFFLVGLARSFARDSHGVQVDHQTVVTWPSMTPICFEHREWPPGTIRELGWGELSRCAIGYRIEGHFWLDDCLWFDRELLDKIEAGKICALSVGHFPGDADIESGDLRRTLKESAIQEVSLCEVGADPLARIEKLRRIA